MAATRPKGQKVRHRGGPDRRGDRLLATWEAALREGKKVKMVVDTNLDVMTWRNEPHTLPLHCTNLTHASLIDRLFERILPKGVEMRW